MDQRWIQLPVLKQMKPVRFSLLLLLTLCAQPSRADRDGWSFNPLPIAGYDSDFGLMFGGYVDLNCFGGLYPSYRHRFCAEVLVYSRHASAYTLEYDSQYLIPGIRTQAKVYFDDNPLYQFYGFNGSVLDYDRNLNLNRDRGIAFYSYDRQYLNLQVELSGNISGHLSWTARPSFWQYRIRELNWNGYDPDNTLFRQYRQAGLIEDGEADGGNVLELKAGLKYDTRDIEAAPSRGIYADVNIDAAPDIFGTGYDYLKIAARLRHYVSLGTERVVLAYSLAYQSTLAGNPAFYSQPYILHSKPTEGLGGATTLRGVLFNRLTGNDYLWSNVELRSRILDFHFLGRRVFAVATPFLDAGMVTSPFRPDRQAAFTGLSASDLNEKARRLHASYGIGAQLVIDYNFIPTIMFGIPFDRNDGDYGLYMTIDYTF